MSVAEWWISYLYSLNCQTNKKSSIETLNSNNLLSFAGHAGDLKTIRIDILHHASIERGINLPLTSKLIIGVLEYLYLLAAEM